MVEFTSETIWSSDLYWKVLITTSVSCYTCLDFIFLLESVFTICVLLGICLFHLVIEFTDIQLFTVFLYNPFYFCKDSSTVPTSISHLSNLKLLSYFFLVDLKFRKFYLSFQSTNFWFYQFSLLFILILLASTLIFIILFHLLAFVLFLYSFPSSLRCKVKLRFEILLF